MALTRYRSEKLHCCKEQERKQREAEEVLAEESPFITTAKVFVEWFCRWKL
jgi:hypothetical protein